MEIVSSGKSSNNEKVLGYPILKAAYKCKVRVETVKGGRPKFSCFNKRGHVRGDAHASCYIDNDNTYACGVCGSNKRWMMDPNGFPIKTSGNVVDFVTSALRISADVAAQTIDSWMGEPEWESENVGLWEAANLQLQSTVAEHSNCYHFTWGNCAESWNVPEIWGLLKEKLEISPRTLADFEINYIGNYQIKEMERDNPKNGIVFDKASLLEKLKRKYTPAQLVDSGLVTTNGELVFENETLIVPFKEGERWTYLYGMQLVQMEGGKFNFKSATLKKGIPNLFNVQAMLFQSLGARADLPIYVCTSPIHALRLLSEDLTAVSTRVPDEFMSTYLIEKLRQYPFKYILVATEAIIQDARFEIVQKRLKESNVKYRVVGVPESLSLNDWGKFFQDRGRRVV